jgi:hypothetical protein
VRLASRPRLRSRHILGAIVGYVHRLDGERLSAFINQTSQGRMKFSTSGL